MELASVLSEWSFPGRLAVLLVGGLQLVVLLGGAHAVQPGVPDQQDLLKTVVCERSEDGYIIPDPVQCDRYVECTASGKRKINLCTDGFALDTQVGFCNIRANVDCSGREKLQPATGTGLCKRHNGNFPVPAEISCSEYVDCREGQAFHQSCGFGAVFDETLGCVHPDQTTREGCTASAVFGFKCPKFAKRFGDHDRIAHPDDCAYFYACLRNGQPRLLGCKRPKVFNPEEGICTDQRNVPGCEDYYPEAELELDVEREREKIEAEIRAELEKKFGIKSGSIEADLSSSSSRGGASRSRGNLRPDKVDTSRSRGNPRTRDERGDESVPRFEAEVDEPAPRKARPTRRPSALFNLRNRFN